MSLVRKAKNKLILPVLVSSLHYKHRHQFTHSRNTNQADVNFQQHRHDYHHNDVT